MTAPWRDAALALLPRCRFPTTSGTLTCAVSGGADSLALLLLAAANRTDVLAVHVDHGLRPGSDAEGAFVHSVADAVGARFESRQVDVAPGPNLEARARAARYGALPPDALVGHTADDRAETILMHLLRGSGAAGLAALRDDSRRPILRLRRYETAQLCRSAGLTPLADPMNLDPAFTRVRVRGDVIPLLSEVARADIVPLLLRLGDLAGDDDDLLTRMAATLDPTDALLLAATPLPLARRAVRAWLLANCVGDGHPPTLAAVDRVLAVARGDAVSADLIEGWRVMRSRQRLRLVPLAGTVPGRSGDLAGAGPGWA